MDLSETRPRAAPGERRSASAGWRSGRGRLRRSVTRPPPGRSSRMCFRPGFCSRALRSGPAQPRPASLGRRGDRRASRLPLPGCRLREVRSGPARPRPAGRGERSARPMSRLRLVCMGPGVICFRGRRPAVLSPGPPRARRGRRGGPAAPCRGPRSGGRHEVYRVRAPGPDPGEWSTLGRAWRLDTRPGPPRMAGCFAARGPGPGRCASAAAAGPGRTTSGSGRSG